MATEQNELDAATTARLMSLGVSLLYLFGSFAEEMAHDLSDLDIGLVFQESEKSKLGSFALYNQIYDILTDAFHQRGIDIVFLQNAGLEVCFDAISHGRLLFSASHDDRYAFEEKVLILYADFKPILDSFDEAVLGRI